MSLLFLFFLLGFLSSCKALFDPNTEALALSTAELVGTFLLKKGDELAQLEKADGTVNWEDTVADVYLFLRSQHKFSHKEEKILKKQVQKVFEFLRNLPECSDRD